MVDEAIGHGLDFQRSDNGLSTGEFATVGHVRDLTPPGVSRDMVDKTHMLSPERFREFIPALIDAGEASLDLAFDPGDPTTQALLADITTQTAGYYKIVFPDATEWGFAAFLTNIEPGSPLDDLMTATVTFKLTGKPDFIS